MIDQIVSTFGPYELWMLAYVVIYGIPFGVGNTINRLRVLFSGKRLLQADYGRLLDGVFWFFLVILWILNT